VTPRASWRTNAIPLYHDSSRGRSGYTLLELLLVLSILALLVGSTWSAIQAMQNDRRLKEVADQVRSQLAICRTRAIESGVVYQFQYQPGGTTFTAQPFEALDANAAPVDTVNGELPEGVTFATPDDEAATASFAIRTSLAQAANNAKADMEGALVPILFAPDGSATDAAIEIVDESGRFVRMSIRGLTAAIFVGNPQARVTR
jgi:prepilin-type N-terminal cleavage/methylation domain-containing protein